jgi:hypothetical protein
MFRIIGPAALALILIAGGATSEVRAADAWGCSFDKCIQVCTKLAGKNCSKYCNDRLADKRRDKICS